MFSGRPSANPIARRMEAAVPTGIRSAVHQAVCAAARYERPPVRPPAICRANCTTGGLLRPLAVRATVRQAVHCADGLQPYPRALQPPSSAANGTLNGRISDEYKEGSTNTLNLLPNLCFPTSKSFELHSASIA